MKKSKIFIGFMLTLVMVFMTAIPSMMQVLAEGQTGSISIHLLQVDDLDDYDTPGTGQEDNSIDLSKIVGVTFKIEKMVAKAGVEGSSDMQDYVVVQDWVWSGSSANTSKTDASGTLKFDNLPLGVYRITEMTGALISVQMNPFMVSVPMTNPSGDGLLYDVHCYPKNEIDTLDISKKVKGVKDDDFQKSSTASATDVIEWQVKVEIPKDIEDAILFTVKDILDNALEFIQVNGVYCIDQAGQKAYLQEEEDYTFKNITAEGHEVLELTMTSSKNFAGNKYLIIEFETSVSASLPSPLRKIKNGAEIHYTDCNGFGHDAEIEEKNKPYVTIGEICLFKHDSNNDPLDGAQFVIYDNEEDALTDNENYDKATRSLVSASTPWIEESDEKGHVHFRGLAYGKYWIVEVQAPVGYNLLHEPVKVTVDDNTLEQCMEKDDDVLKVLNKSGFTLPNTGGGGTAYIWILGVMLLSGSVVCLLLSRRGKKQKDNNIS